MSTDFVAAIGAGGLAGAIANLLVTGLRDRKRDSQTRERVKTLVRQELKTARDLIQHRMLDPATSGRDMIPFIDTSIEVQNQEITIASLQYPAMSTEIKVKVFDSTMLVELQETYMKIITLKAHRGYQSEHLFEYRRSGLVNLVEDIDKVMKKIESI